MTSSDKDSLVVPPTSNSQDLRSQSGQISETPSGDFVSMETKDKTSCDKKKTLKRTDNNNLDVPDENFRFS